MPKKTRYKQVFAKDKQVFAKDKQVFAKQVFAKQVFAKQVFAKDKQAIKGGKRITFTDAVICWF